VPFFKSENDKIGKPVAQMPTVDTLNLLIMPTVLLNVIGLRNAKFENVSL
jgi:hypothetical protein